MKLLLDESIPRKLASAFPHSHDVDTVPQMGWAGVKNGKLLTLAVENGYHALITADQGIAYQQNTQHLRIHIIILVARRTHISHLSPLVPKVIELLETTPKFGVYNVAAEQWS